MWGIQFFLGFFVVESWYDAIGLNASNSCCSSFYNAFITTVLAAFVAEAAAFTAIGDTCSCSCYKSCLLIKLVLLLELCFLILLFKLILVYMVLLLVLVQKLF